MTRRCYGLQRDRQWLLPPATPLPGPGQVISDPPMTDDPRKAWAAFDIDAAIERRFLLIKAWGITTTIRAIPHE